MKFYIAASFSAREHCLELANDITAESLAELTCTSRWIRDRDESAMSDYDICMEDCEDLAVADAVLLIHGSTTKGGKWVELGLAIAWEKPVLFVRAPFDSRFNKNAAPLPNVFTSHPRVSSLTIVAPRIHPRMIVHALRKIRK